MQQTETAKLKVLAEHARLSHAHWLGAARKGGAGKYGPAYCIEGAGIWRRRPGDLQTLIRHGEPATVEDRFRRPGWSQGPTGGCGTPARPSDENG